MQRTALSLILALTCMTASGATVFGNHDCGRWIKDRSGHAKSWLLGYLSGLNLLGSTDKQDPLDQLRSAEQAFVWMDNYCQKDPLSTVAAGARELYIELRRRVPNQ